MSLRDATALEGASYSMTTTAIISPTITPSPVLLGSTKDSRGNPVSGALIYIRIRDATGRGSPGESALLSTLTNASGGWTVPMNSARDNRGLPFAWDKGDLAVVSATAGMGITNTVAITIDTAGPVAGQTVLVLPLPSTSISTSTATFTSPAGTPTSTNTGVTLTNTPTATATGTATPTGSPVASSTASATATYTTTPTITPSATITGATSSPTPTVTPTDTPAPAATDTPWPYYYYATPYYYETPYVDLYATASATPTATPTATSTMEPTLTPLATYAPVPTAQVPALAPSLSQDFGCLAGLDLVRLLGNEVSQPLVSEGFTVQYFEKGRIEDHTADLGVCPWATQYGLLVDDLHAAAVSLPVGGDVSTVDYAQLHDASLLESRLAPPDDFAGGVAELGDGSVFIPYDATLAPAPGHIVPPRFWEYINRSDLFPGGWLHDFGLPLTEAFPASVTKGNEESRTITIQAFQRIILTDDTQNPPDWQIERVNVGSDYKRAFPDRVP